MTLSTKQQRSELITNYVNKMQSLGYCNRVDDLQIALLLKNAGLTAEVDKVAVRDEIWETGLFTRKTHNNNGAYFYSS